MHLFMTGCGSTGKSHVVKTFYQAVSKLLLYQANYLKRPRANMLVLIGISAVNMAGATIHDKMQNILSETKKMIIIDEILMIFRYFFHKNYAGIIEIFLCAIIQNRF